MIIVNRIGLYDHVGIRKDTETEFQYIRIENGVNTFRTTLINPNVDNIYFTMFDPLYNELDEYLGSPANLNTISPILYELNASPQIQIFKNGGNIITNETDFLNFVTLQSGVSIDSFTVNGLNDVEIILNPYEGQYEINTYYNDSPFLGNSDLTELLLPGCLTLGRAAFKGCNNLITINCENCTLIDIECFLIVEI